MTPRAIFGVTSVMAIYEDHMVMTEFASDKNILLVDCYGALALVVSFSRNHYRLSLLPVILEIVGADFYRLEVLPVIISDVDTVLHYNFIVLCASVPCVSMVLSE